MLLSRNRSALRRPRRRELIAAAKGWLAALACIAALLAAGPAATAPRYMSYFGLAHNIAETQDHVNLYWAVSWVWDLDEVVSELADAKGRGMQAIVHTEPVFFQGSGPYANACPYTIRPDGAERWDAFAQTLSNQGLLDTVAAFYPVDEPDLCGLSSGEVLATLAVIRSHPLTAGKAVAVIFTCDIAEKYGGIHRVKGEHRYGDAVRAYDWVGVDCYGVDNIFTDPAWYRVEFDTHCFCFRSIPGPSYYDNLKAQLNLPAQRVILVPQGFIAADGLPDDPQLFASRGAADPAVILMAPFTWFDMPYSAGVRSQPALAQQWRSIGKSIAQGDPPNGNPQLPEPVAPRLKVSASDVRHFSVYDLNCNATTGEVCAARLQWQAANADPGTQLFLRGDAGARALVACSPAQGYVDIPWIHEGSNYAFELYQAGSCATTIAPGASPIASIDLSLSHLVPVRAATSPNYQGLWWNAPAGSESGWGVNIAHQGDTIFATWYTFAGDGRAQWYSIVAQRIANYVYSGPISSFTGLPFNAVPYSANANVRTPVGTATITFSANGRSATFTYTVNGITQTKQILPQEFASPVPTCVWGAHPDLTQATNYQDLWWVADGAEAGWGVNFTHQGNVILATWFTYDEDGRSWWLFAVAMQTAVPNVFAGKVKTAAGPPFNAEPFDGDAVARTTVGDATISIVDGNHVTLDYTVNGVALSKNLTRQVFAPPGTVCR